ncbi:MAG: ROK family protein, partial [Clostridium sp.]|nr:ROK family protein [Clostridium sp.]
GLNVSRLAQKGDPTALKAFEMEGRYLGQVVAMCCSVLDPEKVIIGGGVSQSFDQFREPLLRTVKQELNIGGKNIPLIRPTGLGYDGGLLGAAAVAVLELNHFGG